MNEIFQVKRSHARSLTPDVRLSSALPPLLQQSAPVAVSLARPRMADVEEARRASVRSANLQAILKAAFDNSVAQMAAFLEMAPDRLRSLLEAQTPFDAEIAEHLEKSLNLPGGWLDNRRGNVDEAHLRETIFAPSRAETQDDARVDAADSTAVQAKPVQAGIEGAAETAPKSATQEPASHPLPRSEESPMSAAVQEALSVTQAPAQARKAHAEPQRHTDDLAQTLRWINDSLDKLRWVNDRLEVVHEGASPGEGISARTELSNRLGRAQSTLSTWLTGLRPIPEVMIPLLADALLQMRAPVAEEANARLRALAPHAFTGADAPQAAQPSAANAAPKAKAAPQPATPPSASADSAPSPVSAGATVHTLPTPLLPARPVSQEDAQIKLTVARTAEKVADVLRQLLHGH